MKVYFKRKKAFTLAEVLITLGIVGVVAALILPSVFANYKKMVYTTQFKKVYSLFSESFKRMIAKEEVSNISETKFYFALENQAEMTSVLKSYMSAEPYNKKIEYAYLNDTSELVSAETLDCTTDLCYVLPDGTVFKFIYQGDNGANVGQIDFTIDINGEKLPNRVGRDYFSFSLLNDGSFWGLGSKNHPCEEWGCLLVKMFDWRVSCNYDYYGKINSEDDYIKDYVLKNDTSVSEQEAEEIVGALTAEERQALIDSMEYQEYKQEVVAAKELSMTGIGCAGRIIEKGKMDY